MARRSLTEAERILIALEGKEPVYCEECHRWWLAIKYTYLQIEDETLVCDECFFTLQDPKLPVEYLDQCPNSHQPRKKF